MHPLFFNFPYARKEPLMDDEPKFIDKVRKHVKRHQVAYSFGAGVVVTGVTVFIFRSALSNSPNGPLSVMRPLFVFSNDNKMVNVIAVAARDGRGHPGYPVICTETGDFFWSQGGGALWAGVSDRAMSRHLNGIASDVGGWHFERVPAIPAVLPKAA
jgi:hypothetical protein